MAPLWRFLERICVAVGLLVLAVSVGVAVLVAPWFTRTLTSRLDVAASSGLSAERAAETAEHVRRFVTDRAAPPLPARVNSRSAFDAAAVSHLRDVRDVILAARAAAFVLAVALLGWAVVSIKLRRLAETGSALLWAGVACIVAPFALAIAGTLSFDALFTAFHGLFFESGTWLFPFDSLLIELFPESFWAAAGVALGVLVAAQGAGLVLLGKALRSRGERPSEGPQRAMAEPLA